MGSPHYTAPRSRNETIVPSTTVILQLLPAPPYCHHDFQHNLRVLVASEFYANTLRTATVWSHGSFIQSDVCRSHSHCCAWQWLISPHGCRLFIPPGSQSSACFCLWVSHLASWCTPWCTAAGSHSVRPSEGEGLNGLYSHSRLTHS